MEEQALKSKMESSVLERLLKFIGISFCVMSIIALIIYKLVVPEFSGWKIFGIIFGVIVFSAGLFFGFNIYHKLKKDAEDKKKEKKVPPPAKQEVILEILNDSLINTRYYNHVKKTLETKPYNIGKNLIYDFKVETLYDNKTPHILINANYPDMIPAVLFNPAPNVLQKAINSMSTHPAEDPDTEITTTTNPILGITTETKKKTKTNKTKLLKPHQVKGDLK